MTTTPLAIGEDAPSLTWDGTRRPALSRTSSCSPIKSLFDASPAFSLRLSKVIGTTTTSASGFDFNASKSIFVTCAGSVVVWNQVEPDLTITQRFFRAHPSVAPQPVTSNEPSTPTRSEFRKSRLSPIRASTIGVQNAPASPTQSNPGTPGRSGARQGSRAAACLSLSSDARTLAVGEVGYNPQIYIFSCTSDNPYPIAALSEHGYGVRCVALSADARWLASVGDIHDGYIFLWSLTGRAGGVKLQASNKCTSSVNAMTWMGYSVVTVGLRHVKVWRPNAVVPSSPTKSKFRPELTDSAPPSPGSRTLHGRNCILGDLLESDFTCISALSSTRAIIGTASGELCVLDDGAGAQKLTWIRKLAYPIHCISIDHENQRIWIGGANRQIRCISYEELDTWIAASTVANESSQRMCRGASNDTINFIGLAPLANCTVGLDSARNIQIMAKCDSTVSRPSILKEYPSHRGPVLAPAVAPQSDDAGNGFMTYDSSGAFKLWDRHGTFRLSCDIPLDQLPMDEYVEKNELKVARVSSSGKELILGDKYGILKMVDLNSWDPVFSIRAHQGEINDIAFSQQPNVSELAASAGRDRSIQIFEMMGKELTLLQTIDQHTSSVSCIAFSQDGKTFLSASADRTVAVYALASAEESRAYLPLRVMTLKQSPVSMVLDAKEPSVLYVSTVDKQMHTFDTSTGQCTSSNRTTDEKQTNTVLLSSATLQSFEAGATRKRLLIGASSTDKSVRVHDVETGLVVTHEYGHSEGVGGVTVTSSSNLQEGKSCQIVSAGLDGTVMLWDLTFAPRSPDQPDFSTSLRETPTLASPLRRVLPRNTFADLSKSLEADGLAPIPQPTSLRGSSPTRRRMSTVSVTGSPKPQTPRARRLERSSSPATPSTPTQAQKKLAQRALPMEPQENICESAASLCRALRSFQASVTASSQGLTSRASDELEVELKATLKSIGKAPEPKPRAVPESPMDQLLERYVERLTQLVEEKVSVTVTSRTSTVESSEVSSSAEGSEWASENEESSPPLRLVSVSEE